MIKRLLAKPLSDSILQRYDMPKSTHYKPNMDKLKTIQNVFIIDTCDYDKHTNAPYSAAHT